MGRRIHGAVSVLSVSDKSPTSGERIGCMVCAAAGVFAETHGQAAGALMGVSVRNSGNAAPGRIG
jgi:hypothetical protein